MKKEAVIGKFQFESKTSEGKIYEVLVYADNTLSCNCKGWIFARNGERSCKHTKIVYSDMMNHVKQKKPIKMIPCNTDWVIYQPGDLELLDETPELVIENSGARFAELELI